MIPDAHASFRPAPARPRAPGGGILSRSEFFKTYGNRFGAPGSGAYTGYVNFRTNQPKLRAAARASAAGAAPPGHVGAPASTFDPLAILTDAELRARATAAVSAANAPLQAQLEHTYSQRGEEQAAQLAALTKMAVEAAGKYGPTVGAAYGGAQHDQAATDSALASLLHGGGVQAAGELAGKLGAGSPVAAGAGAIGTGAAGANLATGSADLTRLLSQGAAAQDYGAKLPGIAAGHGLDTASRMASQLDRELAAAIDSVKAQQPGQVESLYQQGQSNRTSVALAKAGGLVNEQKAITAATKATQAATYQALSLDEKIRHNKAIEQNQAASVAERKAAREANVVLTQQKAHGTAVHNRGNALTKAQTSLSSFAKDAAHPKPTKTTVPAVSAGGTPIRGKTVTKTVAGSPKPYKQLLRDALLLPSVQLMLRRFNYKPAQIRAMLDQYLEAFGYAVPSGGTTGNRGNRPG